MTVSPAVSLVAGPALTSAGVNVIVPMYPAWHNGDPVPTGPTPAAAGAVAVRVRAAAPAVQSSSFVVRRRRLCLIAAAVARMFTAGSFPLAAAKPGPGWRAAPCLSGLTGAPESSGGAAGLVAAADSSLVSGLAGDHTQQPT